MTQELKIHIYGSSILEKKTESLRFIGDQERQLFALMCEVMHKAGGVGLAANQVGIDKQMLVIDIGSGPIKMANPKIIKKSGKQNFEEGCLSLPEITINVKRAKDIVVTGIDEYNQRVKLDAHDLLARVFQHEVDHLNGKLIIGYVPWHKKFSLSRALSVLKEGRSK